MSFSHLEEKRNDRLLDVVIDEESGFRLIISRLGAELVSLARRDQSGEWRGFLYRDNDTNAPAKGWANHATVMGYFLHRLKDGKSFYRGQEIKGGTHSFLRHKQWHLVSAANGSNTYRITPEDFTATEYPLKVSLDLTYTIEQDSINVRFAFRNEEPTLTAHVGFGLHPGFAATAFETFQFRMPPGKYRRHFSPDNYLSGETADLEFGGGEMPFPRDQLPGSFILEFIDVPSREFTYLDPPSGRSVALDLSETPYLTLWSDGGPFLCIEPCWGLTDAHKQQAFEKKEGIQTIGAGAQLIKQFRMTPRLLGNP